LPMERTQRVAEQRLEFGIGRDELLGHILHILRAPGSRSRLGHVVGQGQGRAKSALRLCAVVAQYAAQVVY